VRKTYIIMAVFGVAVTALPALADMQIRLFDGYGTTNGGEFDVRDVGTIPVPFVTNVAQSSYDFVTFCIERNEYIAYNTPYSVVLNTAAIGGGVAGGNPDPLDAKTAYLYTRFTDGTLSNYNYAGSSRNASADELQEAIWYIEQEVTSINGQALAWYNEAVAAVAPGGSWYTNWGNTIGQVRVMNLYTAGHAGEFAHQKQDQLVRIPAPGAVVLGALGLSLVGWVNRRKS